MTENIPIAEIKQALTQSEEIEGKVQQCADDLATVNAALSDEIIERTSLKRDLSDSKARLSESEAELTASQAEQPAATRKRRPGVLLTTTP